MNFGASFSPRMEQAASHSICSIGLVEGTVERRFRRVRRRVTCLADSASPGTGSEVSIPASAASATIAARAAFCGMFTPPSQRFTLANDTPSRSASCSWVRSSLARMARNVVETACVSVICALYQILHKMQPPNRNTGAPRGAGTGADADHHSG